MSRASAGSVRATASRRTHRATSPRITRSRARAAAVRKSAGSTAAAATRSKAPGRPFTLAHFRPWCAELVLDNGQAFILEPFQEEFIADVFERRADHAPRFTELWDVIPEENGKTTLVAALVLYHLEYTPDAFVPVAAASRDQAETLYRQAEGFVLRSKRLNGTTGTRLGLMVCQPGYRKIRLRTQKHVRIQIFAADADTADSVIPTLAVIDELHRHKNMKLYRTWTGKLRKRKGQLIVISTGGEAGSEFEQTRTRLRESGTEVVRRTCFTRAAGVQFVIHDWSLPDKADPEDLAVVKNANPFSGITIATLREKRASPTMTLGHWLRFTCNRPTRSEDAAIAESEWLAGVTKEAIPAGAPIDLGVDIGRKWDTTALVPYWHKSKTHRQFGAAVIFTPPRDGTSLKDAPIKAAIRDIHARNPIGRVVIDPHDASELIEWMRDELHLEVIERSQTNAFAVMDYDRFMEALRSTWIRHAGDGGLTRHALNAITRILPGGEKRFDRSSSTRQGGDQERRVIDALVAGAMVHAVAAAPVEDEKKPKLKAW